MPCYRMICETIICGSTIPDSINLPRFSGLFSTEDFFMAYEVTLVTGDGTGPELATAARRCVDATGVKINWDVQEAGVDVMLRLGTPLPEAVMESVRRTRCALKAPITTPVGTGFRSINVHLRQALGLYACIRPCKHYPGVRTFFNSVPVDLVIVRENTEDLYAG